MKRLQSIEWVLVLVVLLAAAGAGVMIADPGRMDVLRVRNTPTATPAGATETPPAPAPTPTPSGTTVPPVVGDNLLVNGDFIVLGHYGWNQVNNYWGVHSPLPCGPYDGNYAEMDRDGSNQDKWPPGGEDVLFQDVTAPPHSVVYFSWVEAGHMHSTPGAYIDLVLLGKVDFDDTWAEVGFWEGPLSKFGAGKCSKDWPPEQFTFAIIPEAAYSFYRVEIRGGIPNPYDGSGILLGGFSLVVQ